VPERTLVAMFRQALGDCRLRLEDLPSYQLGVRVADLSRIELIASQLQEILPDDTVLSCAQLATWIEESGVDLPRGTVLYDWYGPPAEWPTLPVRPIRLGPVFRLLFLAMAACIVTLTFTTLVGRRRTEIAILKALGARRGDVMAMVLVEVLLISMCGSLLGAAMVAGPALWTAWTNQIGFAEICRRLLCAGAGSLAWTLFAALLGGLSPAWFAASISVNEVFNQQ